MGQDEIELIEYVSLDNMNIPENRVSFDNTVNNYGTRLLPLCKSLYMFIVNGRMGNDALVGRPTCRNVSVVDYFICTPRLFLTIVNFEVEDFNLYDVHNAVRLTLIRESHCDPDTHHATPPPNLPQHNSLPLKPKWKHELGIQYEETLLEGDVSGILRELDRLSSDTFMQTEVNKVVSDINYMFNDAARSLGMFRSGLTTSGCSRSRVRSEPHKNWYNQKCENKRKIFLKHKNKYRRLRNNNNLQQLQQTGKDYKNEINKAVRKYKQQVIHKIRNLKSENPRDYWNIINNKNNSKTTAKVSLEIFKEHFENLNYSHDNQNVTTLDFIDSDSLLNDPFTTEEVNKLIAKIKNSKSPGTDQILNEFLKKSLRQITTMLTKLFNVILASGVVPEQWSIGVIKPIYKSSGDDSDPGNYRGITLLSCIPITD